jgi:hypothetical protein
MAFFLHFLIQLVLPKPGRAKRGKVPTSEGANLEPDVEPTIHHLDNACNYL